MEFTQLLDKILNGKSAAGCSEEEIAALESQFHVTFPSTYREFLLRAGKGAGELWRGSDYTVDVLPDLQDAAVELLSEANLEMPSGSFVFFMHQGYQFFLFNNEGVFYFLEGNKKLEKKYDSFEEFFKATAQTL